MGLRGSCFWFLFLIGENEEYPKACRKGFFPRGMLAMEGREKVGGG